MKTDNLITAAIAGIADASKIRVVLFAGNRLAHVALKEILSPYEKRIDELSERVKVLEKR